MASRALLRLTTQSTVRVPNRGMAAVRNWKRPSVDEIGLPHGSWAATHAKKNAQFNILLGSALAFFVATVSFAKFSGLFKLYGAPHHIIAEFGKKE